jgi:hypothetical protein
MSGLKRAYRSFMQGPILIILFGLAFFGIGAGLSYKYFNLQLNGEQAQGQVIGLSEQCDDEGCAYAPVVSFQTRDGRTVTYRSSYASSPPAYDVGESVTVYFDPENPEKPAIKGEGSIFRIIFVTVGGSIMIFGLYTFGRNLINPIAKEG